MLLPSFLVQDLSDRPTTLRITDTTTGYGLSGDPTRQQIERAVVEVDRWTEAGPAQRSPVLRAELPASYWQQATAVDLNYPAGSDVSGDGLLIFTVSYYSRVSVPVTKATYEAVFGRTTDPAVHRVLIRRNGVLVELPPALAATALSGYREEATADVLTDFRIETLIDNQLIHCGTFTRSHVFLSPTTTTTTTELALAARQATAVLLLGRSRRRLNELAERLAFDHCQPLAQYLADGLVWLRMYERLAELNLNQSTDHSPYRISQLLTDLHQTLQPLWLRYA